MIDNSEKYGLLLTKDITLHRLWFKQMCDLIGIKVVYRAPRANKNWTTYTELETNYEKPFVVGCIFEDHPQQQTMKKLGWVSSLQQDASIIHVTYDLAALQVGALFIIPSGIDFAEGRLFRVAEMKTGVIYPASVSCLLVPEYEDTFSNSQLEYKHTSFNLLQEEEE